MWLTFDGILNVRDLGGIPTADGRAVKAGRLLRGAGLANAGDADLKRLETQLKLRHIVDFRDAVEVTRRPDRAVAGAEYHHLPTLPGLPGPAPMLEGEPDFAPLFARLYEALATTQEAHAAYRALFRILLDCPEGAVYFHCTQGKDRTGVGALLILAALGVTPEAAQQDYFLSNTGLAEAMEHPESPGADRWRRETKERLFFVFPDTLAVYHRCIEADWGGMDGYLRRGLGLTDADLIRLREMYLE